VCNDRSVLENMHCANAFKLMKHSSVNIFAPLTPELRSEVRESIIAMVLATDMKHHFRLLAEFQAAIDKKKSEKAWFDHTKVPDRVLLLEVAIHASDLGNPAKAQQLCVQHTEHVFEEFFQQGDKERELGIPISLLCDRSKPNVEKSQVGFIDVVVAPLFRTLMVVAPEIKVCCDTLDSNRLYWQSRTATSPRGTRAVSSAKFATLPVVHTTPAAAAGPAAAAAAPATMSTASAPEKSATLPKQI